MKVGHQSRLAHLLSLLLHHLPEVSQGSLPLPYSAVPTLCTGCGGSGDPLTCHETQKKSSLWNSSKSVFPAVVTGSFPPCPSLVTMLPIFKKVNISQPWLFPGSAGKAMTEHAPCANVLWGLGWGSGARTGSGRRETRLDHKLAASPGPLTFHRACSQACSPLAPT